MTFQINTSRLGPCHGLFTRKRIFSAEFMIACMDFFAQYFSLKSQRQTWRRKKSLSETKKTIFWVEKGFLVNGIECAGNCGELMM